jgi:alpha-N-arabinofuranosidase
MKTIFVAFLTVLTFVNVTRAVNFHVAPSGNDADPGTQTAPFRTIQHAANLAQPGDVITVHEGVYRERISPLRGANLTRSASSIRPLRGRRLRSKGRKSSKAG